MSRLPRGARAGTGLRPYWNQATPTPRTSETIVEAVTAVAETGEFPCSNAVTGSSQSTNASPALKRPPAKTEPKASTIIGIVMIFGDSCGCGSRPSASGCQRFSPKKVISITRVM